MKYFLDNVISSKFEFVSIIWITPLMEILYLSLEIIDSESFVIYLHTIILSLYVKRMNGHQAFIFYYF